MGCASMHYKRLRPYPRTCVTVVVTNDAQINDHGAPSRWGIAFGPGLSPTRAAVYCNRRCLYFFFVLMPVIKRRFGGYQRTVR